MIDLNDIAIFAKATQLESVSRAARALGIPGHAMLGFKIDQQRGTVLTMAALVPSVRFNGTITRAKSGSKARLADARFGGFHRHSQESLRGSALSRKQPNMLLVTRSLLVLWTPRAVHPAGASILPGCNDQSPDLSRRMQGAT